MHDDSEDINEEDLMGHDILKAWIEDLESFTNRRRNLNLSVNVHTYLVVPSMPVSQQVPFTLSPRARIRVASLFLFL